jgi:hypothetical protein
MGDGASHHYVRIEYAAATGNRIVKYTVSIINQYFISHQDLTYSLFLFIYSTSLALPDLRIRINNIIYMRLFAVRLVC